MSATDALIDFVTTAEDIPKQACTACQTFLLDSLGVAVAGSAAPWADKLIDMQTQWGTGSDARSWVFGASLPAPAAAFSNAYQIHNSEFDCIHEAAVVHPMAVTLPTLMAVAEREGNVSGSDFLAALTIGVDVACTIGIAATGGMRFFRPATAGAFGAVAGIGRLLGFDTETLRSAMGVVYGQLSGNMQAHTEGSVLLAMQVGFNARNAVIACDLAATGIAAPRDMLEGEFGYFKLFEESHAFEAAVESLGKVWQIAETAHKPFPSGRATHGVLDAVLELQREAGFSATEVSRIEARVPSLTHQLVARTPQPRMTPNQARLCIGYVVARALRNGTLGVEDFTAQSLSDPETFSLADKVSVGKDENLDPSALSPITVRVTLQDGQTLERTQDLIYGNPAKPMSRDGHLDKFRTNWTSGARALPAENAERLIEAIDNIETISDMREIVDLIV
ncbi:MAG: MmgE/PrpD family protein [Alphaproteobacteria bacterium]|nr:MmgE/PrpD family protein [Alphaproteobacteria bacterium]